MYQINCLQLVFSASSSEAEVAGGYEVLLALLLPAHGKLPDLCALVFRQLANGLTRSGLVGAKSSDWGVVRSAVLSFAERAIAQASDDASAGVDAVAALARIVVLKAIDRVDARAAAADLSIALLRLLPEEELETFVVFAARLSRTPKV